MLPIKLRPKASADFTCLQALELEDGHYLPVFTQGGVRVLQEIEREKEEGNHEGYTGSTQPDSFVFDGPGAWYEVIPERVALRVGPSLGAKALGQIRRGEHVELFGWDETGKWRECVDHRLSRSGFVMLDHPELGPLLRPCGEPLCIRPLNVVAVAAMEGRYVDLDRFLSGQDHKDRKDFADFDFQDPRGPAIVLAAQRGQWRCCLRLLRAGATEGNSAELRALRRCTPEELEEQKLPFPEFRVPSLGALPPHVLMQGSRHRGRVGCTKLWVGGASAEKRGGAWALGLASVQRSGWQRCRSRTR